MNMHGIPMWASALRAGTHWHVHRHPGHVSDWQHPMSRRQFARTVAGATVVGASLGSGLWSPGLAKVRGSNVPTPIPGIGFMGFHVFGAPLETSTITDFNGFVGIASLNGMVTQTNMKTGAVRRLPFLDVDMRFMQGVFRDTEGVVHQGAFALGGC